MRREWVALVGAIGMVIDAAATPMQTARTAEVDVRSAWVREASQGQASTAAYFVLENRTTSPATLVGASSPAAATAELHTMQHTMAPGSMPSGGGPMGGMMRMMQLQEVVVPARGTVEFKPGGHHVMLINVTQALTVGSSVQLTLRFADGSTKTVAAVVGTRAAVSAPMERRP